MSTEPTTQERTQDRGLDAARLEDFVTAVLEARQLPHDDAACVAAALVRSDMRGVHTHGVARLRAYVDMLDEGLLTARPAMSHEDRGGAIVLDADGAMGPVVAREVFRLARPVLESQACVFVSVRDTGHLGALGVHALPAAEQGLICLAGQETPVIMAMPGFERAAIGNNPLAFACPLPDAPPLVFDMACSEAARGHVLLAAAEGRPIPAGWAVDSNGRPTTEAQAALTGALLPAGGAKGLGLALLVQVLAGCLSANEETVARPVKAPRQGGGVSRAGAFFCFVSPERILGSAMFDSAMRRWLEHFNSASGTGQARLPGARGAALEARARAFGVPLPAAVLQGLEALAVDVGVPFGC